MAAILNRSPKDHPVRFGLILFSGFRGEDWNVKGLKVKNNVKQTPSDGKSSLTFCTLVISH